MSFDFPGSPAVGQTVTNGPSTFKWDGVKWTVAGGAGFQDAPADGNTYGRRNASWSQAAPLASPGLTGTPTAPTATAGTSTTQVATTAFVAAAVGTPVTSFNSRTGAVTLSQTDIVAVGALGDVGRNLIHNAQMAIAQRGVGPFTTAGGYTLDRWQASFVADSNSFSQVAFAPGGIAGVDESAAMVLSNNFTGTSGATAFSTLAQGIEDVRRLSNKTVTVSFYANSSAGQKLGVSLDQNFGTGGSPSATVNGNGQAVTLGTSWGTRYVLTFTLPSVSGKTLGTNGDHRTILFFWYSSGANNATRAGNVGVQSGIISIYGVQLEIGSVATPLAKRDPADDLALCQRFCWVAGFAGGAYSSAGGALYLSLANPSTMRVGPAVTLSGLTYTNASGASLYSSNAVTGIVLSAVATAAGPGVVSGIITASADL